MSQKAEANNNIERPGLSQDQIDQLREAFNLFDMESKGKINPRELQTAMQQLGFDQSNQTIFNLISKLDADKEINFEQFLDEIASKWEDKPSKNGVDKLFDLFNDDEATLQKRKKKRQAAIKSEHIDDKMLQKVVEQIMGKVEIEDDEPLSEDDFYNLLTKNNH